MASYTNELRDATAYNPQLTDYAVLSASDNSLVVDSFGTVNGRTVVAVLYDPITSPAAGVATLSAGTGMRFRASTSFNARTIAFEYSDGLSSLVTLTTAFGTSTRQNVSAVGSDEISPNSRRLAVLGFR